MCVCVCVGECVDVDYFHWFVIMGNGKCDLARNQFRLAKKRLDTIALIHLCCRHRHRQRQRINTQIGCLGLCARTFIVQSGIAAAGNLFCSVLMCSANAILFDVQCSICLCSVYAASLITVRFRRHSFESWPYRCSCGLESRSMNYHTDLMLFDGLMWTKWLWPLDASCQPKWAKMFSWWLRLLSAVCVC